MTTPRIEIDLAKIAHNAKKLTELYGKKGIDIIGVTKAVCGDPNIANALLISGISVLADSRIANIRRMCNAGIQAQYVLLRPPIPSRIEDVCQDAFGHIPEFQDRGQIRRAILGVGLQDILGASGDQTIVDAKQTNLRAGNIVEFDLNYGALLSAMTSPYVMKKYVNNS